MFTEWRPYILQIFAVGTPVLSRKMPAHVPLRSPRSSTSTTLEYPGEWECTKCQKTFTTKQGHDDHMKSHRGQFKYWCDVCKVGYQASANYRQHMASRHEGRSFPCQFCPKRFQTEVTLKYHQSEHTGKYLYNCQTCQKGFNYKPEWEKHQNRHAGIRFSCRACGRDFYHEGFRNSHEKKCVPRHERM